MSEENLRVVGRVLQKQLDDARNLVSLVMRREKQKRNLVQLQMPLWIMELEEDGVANKKEIEHMTRILLEGESEGKKESKEKSNKAKKREKKIRKRVLESTRFCTSFFFFLNSEFTTHILKLLNRADSNTRNNDKFQTSSKCRDT
jgi:predicted ATP-dependent protease